MSVTRNQIVETARWYIDTPWAHQGRLRHVGVDCIGLLIGVGLDCGIADAERFADDPSLKGYGRQPDGGMLLRAVHKYFDIIPVNAAKLGDAFVFRFESAPQHFGIISRVDPYYVIHALAQAKRVREHRIDELWWSRIVCAIHCRDIVDHG